MSSTFIEKKKKHKNSNYLRKFENIRILQEPTSIEKEFKAKTVSPMTSFHLYLERFILQQNSKKFILIIHLVPFFIVRCETSKRKYMSHKSTLKKRDWTSHGANRENEAYKMFIISLISSGKSKTVQVILEGFRRIMLDQMFQPDRLPLCLNVFSFIMYSKSPLIHHLCYFFTGPTSI